MTGLRGYQVVGVLRAENIARVRTFYTDVLGLEERGLSGPTREGAFLAGGDSAIYIYERPGMPAPQNTTLAFSVPAAEFDVTIADLRGRGVAFEDYDVPEIGLKTVNGIAEFDGDRVAWFKDSEGNIVSLGTM